MQIEIGLNPNCSEAVVRFNGHTATVETSDFGSIENWANHIRDEIKVIKEWESKKEALKNYPVVIYDSFGGGADIDGLARIAYLLVREAYDKVKVNLEKVWGEETGNKTKLKIQYGSQEF